MVEAYIDRWKDENLPFRTKTEGEYNHIYGVLVIPVQRSVVQGLNHMFCVTGQVRSYEGSFSIQNINIFIKPCATLTTAYKMALAPKKLIF